MSERKHAVKAVTLANATQKTPNPLARDVNSRASATRSSEFESKMRQQINAVWPPTLGLQRVERQAIVGQIGHEIGNRYLQRMMPPAESAKHHDMRRCQESDVNKSDRLFDSHAAAMSSGSSPALLSYRSPVVQTEGQDGSELSSRQLGKVQVRDAPFDVIAHDIAYEDRISSKNNALLKEWGFLEGWQSVIIDSDTGFFAGIILPHPDNPKNRKPIIAFRGSANPSKSGLREIWNDWVENDLNPSGVGVPQFNSVKARVSNTIDMHKPIDITGHSLGGALAQKFAALHPSSINRVVTFQSPGIAKTDVAKFQSARKRPQVTHHIAKGDLVDFSGEASLPGEVYEHYVATTGSWAGAGPASHGSRLLGGAESANVVPTKKYDEYPHYYRRKGGEFLRSNFTTAAKIRLSLSKPTPFEVVFWGTLLGGTAYGAFENSLHELSKSIIAHPEYISAYPLAVKVNIIESLFDGATFDAAERAILTILQVSVQDNTFVQLVDKVDAWKLADQLDGKEYRRLREMLRQHYYSQMSESKAKALIDKCIPTSKWQSEMIIDILQARRTAARSIDR